MAPYADSGAQQNLLPIENPPQPNPPFPSTQQSTIMSRLSIPIDALTSRLNLSGRFDGLQSQSLTGRFANLRPITEFFDIKRISKPANFSEVQSRVNYNLGYFSSNYAAVFVMLSIYSLLTNLTLLFVIFLVVGGMYGIGKLQGNDLQIGSWRATTAQLYTTLLVICIPLGFWASPFTTVLWLIGASGVTILGHAAFMDKPIEFQELDSGDENNGVLLDQGYNMGSNGKQPFNPDELYFNDMDIRAWERRAAEVDGLAYGEDYGYLEDEGYYEDVGDVMMSAAEYQELLFQRTLDKIRLARATGEVDVQLTPEELEVYQNRLWGQRAPAARPQARTRPLSAPVIHGNTNTSAATTSSNTGASGSNSPRSKKNQRRSSIFGGKAKKEKSSNRARATSNATESTIQQAPPGFLIPGPNGQPMFAPINAYQGYNGREVPRHHPGSPSQPESSKGIERLPSMKGNNTNARGALQAQTPSTGRSF
ncbi:Prenylated Rab acceptor 1 [Kalmusia sp. IMI 367209]|nr:Prenylated Rab acceptor 1 [Kalmusia sp. IMI 367209]